MGRWLLNISCQSKVGIYKHIGCWAQIAPWSGICMSVWLIVYSMFREAVISWMSSRIYEVERISALLEPILPYILSFLSFEEVAWTSLLLKSWKQVWPTFPDVVVGDINIKKRRREVILKSLEQTLLNRQG